jgi:hypothetical protein
MYCIAQLQCTEPRVSQLVSPLSLVEVSNSNGMRDFGSITSISIDVGPTIAKHSSAMHPLYAVHQSQSRLLGSKLLPAVQAALIDPVLQVG